MVSIQPRTSLSKFGGDSRLCTDFAAALHSLVQYCAAGMTGGFTEDERDEIAACFEKFDQVPLFSESVALTF